MLGSINLLDKGVKLWHKFGVVVNLVISILKKIEVQIKEVQCKYYLQFAVNICNYSQYLLCGQYNNNMYFMTALHIPSSCTQCRVKSI